MIKKIIIALVFPILFMGCEEEISSDSLNPYYEKLVINEYFNTNEPFSIQVSVSRDAYKEPNPFLLDSTEAKVILKENNLPIPLYFNTFDNTFYSLVKPLAGKTYSITVSSGKYNTVSASGVMPNNILSKNASYIENGGVDQLGNKSDLLKLTFKDDLNTKDYYKLNFYYYSDLLNLFIAYDFELNDILSAVNTIKTRDGGFLFSDESFKGQEKTLTSVPPFGIVAGNPGAKYLIQIQRLNDDFWKYNTTLEQYRGGLNGGSTSSNLFSGAVVVYSNIVNGLGIFAGSNIESDTLK